MSEMVEIFCAINEKRKSDRSKKRISAPELLTQNGIAFESKNFGAHLIVKAGDLTIDFWPGTEKWIYRNSNMKGHGTQTLIRKLTA